MYCELCIDGAVCRRKSQNVGHALGFWLSVMVRIGTKIVHYTFFLNVVFFTSIDPLPLSNTLTYLFHCIHTYSRMETISPYVLLNIDDEVIGKTKTKKKVRTKNEIRKISATAFFLGFKGVDLCSFPSARSMLVEHTSMLLFKQCAIHCMCSIRVGGAGSKCFK